MAEPKKLTTEEILALARKKKADAAAAAAEGASPPASEAAPPTETPPAAEVSPPKPAAPKSTADILAAARAAKAGSTPPAAEKPKSTADILAAARAAKAPAAPAGDKPKSTADILAAARAGKAAAAAPAATSSSEPAPAASAVPAAPAGDRPALKEMVAAVKAANEGKPAAAAKSPVAAKPKLPAKPEPVSRRSALQTLSAIALSPFVIAWVAMSAVAGAWGLGIARFMMPNMVLELPSKFKVGPPSDFPPGTVSEKYKASRGVWIVHSTQYDGRDLIYGLLSICTHLGCTPNWLEGEQKFKCPCHGSGFYITGINFEGPAPRPLERVGLRRSEDGMLEVDKSLKFQEELGQWSDTKSYYQNS
ncbi:ubiquinol-cytochrome c reductase iron-sulfur subunit [Planctomicrobium sp. SH661]|uniref:QcrA and Rieske domain-containing protein n=1 Tax=Planctomicrobium sp. SH661 TaxID=3448124 RepID=UPI003F5B55A0